MAVPTAGAARLAWFATTSEAVAVDAARVFTDLTAAGWSDDEAAEAVATGVDALVERVRQQVTEAVLVARWAA
jgi:hypothetical protein